MRIAAVAAAFCTLVTAAVSLFSHAGRAEAAAGASSAVVIEASTGRVLYAESPDARAYPASTTKILTALVALENLPLGLEVEIPACAAGVEGSSIYLKAGERLTVEELLYGLMLRSGNDAAAALAVAVAGSEARFADMMNERAKECGAANSNFVNPHGLHDEKHYTTARDLALITAEAYKNADFRRIASTRSITVGESGRCLVGGAYRDGMQLVSVVLNRYDMWEATRSMLNAAFDAYEMKDVFSLPVAESGCRAVEVKLDDKGNPHPAAYPVKKSGENIGVVLS